MSVSLLVSQNFIGGWDEGRSHQARLESVGEMESGATETNSKTRIIRAFMGLSVILVKIEVLLGPRGVT